MGTVLNYVLNRLTEPSSLAGIAVIINAAQRHDYIGAVEGVLGLFALIIPDDWKSHK